MNSLTKLMKIALSLLNCCLKTNSKPKNPKTKSLTQSIKKGLLSNHFTKPDSNQFATTTTIRNLNQGEGVLYQIVFQTSIQSPKIQKSNTLAQSMQRVLCLLNPLPENNSQPQRTARPMHKLNQPKWSFTKSFSKNNLTTSKPTKQIHDLNQRKGTFFIKSLYRKSIHNPQTQKINSQTHSTKKGPSFPNRFPKTKSHPQNLPNQFPNSIDEKGVLLYQVISQRQFHNLKTHKTNSQTHSTKTSLLSNRFPKKQPTNQIPNPIKEKGPSVTKSLASKP